MGRRKKDLWKLLAELRENFIRIFATLSTKGDAELNIENRERFI